MPGDVGGGDIEPPVVVRLREGLAGDNPGLTPVLIDGARQWVTGGKSWLPSAGLGAGLIGAAADEWLRARHISDQVLWRSRLDYVLRVPGSDPVCRYLSGTMVAFHVYGRAYCMGFSCSQPPVIPDQQANFDTAFSRCDE